MIKFDQGLTFLLLHDSGGLIILVEEPSLRLLIHCGMLLPERTMLHLVLGFRTIACNKKEQKNNRNVIMSTYLVLPLSDSLCQEYLKEPL